MQMIKRNGSALKKQADYSEFLKITRKFTQFNSLLTSDRYLFVSEVQKLIEQGQFGSINLLKVENAALFLKEENSKPRLWISFYKNGVEYKYKVTYKLKENFWKKLKEGFYNNKENFKIKLPEEVFLTLTGAVFGDFFNIFVSGIIMKESLDVYFERVLK